MSNSWSGNEGTKTYDGDFNVSGVAITAATGDNGHNSTAQWPAILPTVTAVGGNDAQFVQSAFGDGVVGRRQRLQQSLCEAVVPERHQHRLQ